jgi:glyoxylase-like metal-dependent hydrolase (beta-lactamase superfamily II)
MYQHERHDIEVLTPDLARLRVAFVNMFFAGAPSGPWALVDTGLSLGVAQVLEVASARYGRENRPAAIILTHGHFDHVGALETLLAVWDVPVYAHTLELPFLTGKADYPPPDSTVGRGMLARLSPLVPEKGIDVGGHVQPLPESGDVPGMPGWRWVPTPGHSPGHVSLFRDADRALIAGDAVTTTRQESAFSVLTQRQELNGPPAYFTIDWEKARHSVETLANLRPTLVAAGHGRPMRDESVVQELARLAREFDQRARPRRGRYVRQPAVTDEQGVVTIPPPLRSTRVRWGMLTGVAATAVAGTWLIRRFGRRSPLPGAPVAPAAPAADTPKPG